MVRRAAIVALLLGASTPPACTVPEREFVPDDVFYEGGAPDVPCVGPSCLGCDSCFVRCICLGGDTTTCTNACRTTGAFEGAGEGRGARDAAAR